MDNKQQTAVEWFLIECGKYGDTAQIPDEVIDQAKEMEVMGKEMSYADGYAEGYKRALEMVDVPGNIYAKQCALFAVNEILSINSVDKDEDLSNYWEEVKHEIEKL